jgi:thiamine biosynthesis lipoprotein ApbE
MRTQPQFMNVSAIALLASLVSLPQHAHAQVCAGNATVERTTDVAGTPLNIRVSNVTQSCGEAAVNAAIAEAQRIQDDLARWTAAVNNTSAAGHARVPLTGELSRLFDEIDRWVTATDGAFDPAIARA